MEASFLFFRFGESVYSMKLKVSRTVKWWMLILWKGRLLPLINCVDLSNYSETRFAHMYKGNTEEEIANHSSILAKKIPWTEELDGLQSMGSQGVRQDWASEHTHIKEIKFTQDNKCRHEVTCFNECSKNGTFSCCVSSLFLKQHEMEYLLMDIFIFYSSFRTWVQSFSKENGFFIGLLNVDTIRITWGLVKGVLLTRHL